MMRPYTCPVCGRTGRNPADAEARYCGDCHRFEDDPIMTGIPARAEDRARMAGGDRLKALPEGRFPAPCKRCGMPVLIGPRVKARVDGGSLLLCPQCINSCYPGLGPDDLFHLGG